MNDKIDPEDALWEQEPYSGHTRTILPSWHFYRSEHVKSAPSFGVGIIEIAALLIPEFEREGYVEEQISILAEAPTVWQKIRELISALLGLRDLVRELKALEDPDGCWDDSAVPQPSGSEIIVTRTAANKRGYVAFQIPDRSDGNESRK
ncbi:hypothetical protein ACIQSP_18030 [Streptomyces nigra]|uniref:hypothetical protein n=1 Tax=Streptomyces nigra TaxID=1827580 RepID=UPI00383009D6